MPEMTIARDSKLIKVLASQARNERLDSNIVAEANDIIADLAQDLNPQNRHQIAQTVAFTVDELQKNSLDFLSRVADIKTINYGDKAAFNVRTGTIKAYTQAKGATAPRSMVASHQILVPTKQIAVRPAISLLDIKANRVNMGDLIREANDAMTNAKIKDAQKTLQAALAGGTYSSPFFASATGSINKAALDAQIAHFRRLGPVTLMGDIAAISGLAALTGMAFSTTQTQRSEAMIEEYNNNGYIGRYMGCDVIAMTNTFEPNTINPMLDTNYIYIIVGGLTADQKNLKIINEGSVNAMESNNIDDRVEEMLLYQWYGTAFTTGNFPTIGAFKIL